MSSTLGIGRNPQDGGKGGPHGARGGRHRIRGSGRSRRAAHDPISDGSRTGARHGRHPRLRRPAGRQRRQDRWAEHHRPRAPCGLSDRGRAGGGDRRPQGADRHRGGHPGPPPVRPRGRPRTPDRRADGPRHRGRRAERRDAGVPDGALRGSGRQHLGFGGPSGLPCRAPCGHLPGHAPLRHVAARPPGGRHPSLPHRRRLLPRRRGVRVRKDDLRQGRGRALQRQPQA